MRYVLLLGCLCATLGLAQDEPTPSTPAAEAPATPPTPPAGPVGRQNPQDPRPYDQVITKEAKTSKGVFLVHQVRNRYYYEIPESELGKDFLWVSEISRT